MARRDYFIACFLSAFFSVQPLFCETTEVVLSNSMKCTKEELMRFFPEQVVKDVLIKANLPQNQAEAIAHTLSLKDSELTKLVKEKSAQLSISNHESQFTQRDLVTKIYRETLFEAFSNALKENGVTDPDQIQILLESLKEARSKLFMECMKKQPKL